MKTVSPRAKHKVVAALKDHEKKLERRKNSEWTRWARKPTRMTHEKANGFLLGAILDRGVNADRAWDNGEWVAEVLTRDPDDPASLWTNLRSMPAVRLRNFLRYGRGGRAVHRYYKGFSRWLKETADVMIDEYDGDPRKIWNAQRDVNVVRDRLLEIPGIGTGIAEMTLLILARNKGLLGGRKARPSINVKPDVHVRRVFVRTGLVKKGASDREVMAAARELAPDFPGSLDAPCWDIGREYCRPRRPACAECPLTSVCPGIGLSTKRK